MVTARFDDLAPGSERSFRFAGLVESWSATSASEVTNALALAEAAAADGRWVAGFVAYEAAPGLDPAIVVRSADRQPPIADVPLAWFAAFERREPAPQPGASASSVRPAWWPSVGVDAYAAAVERIRSMIADGQTYQVNYTLRMRGRVDGDVEALYEDLVLAQRGGFGALLGTGSAGVASASPELFFRWDDDVITTRPMKGTSRRGRWPAEDERAAARLRASAKDRAENAMIVDLLRNDLGRVAVAGTVSAGPLFELERFETVWQLTSTVRARVPERATLVDVFRALFPSGSVTGAPKIATTRAIAELEDSPRGVYTGAIGYLAPPGSGEPRAVFGVAIRTVVDARTGEAEYGVGSGITFASSASSEYDEVLAKARVLTERRPAFDLFESIAWDATEGFRHLDEHLGRLRGSARYFGFRHDDEAVVAAIEKAVADADGPSRVRLLLGRDGTATATVAPAPATTSRAPLRVAILDDQPVRADDVFLFHKTTRRGAYEDRRARRPDAEDVLLVNTDGRVTESTIANVAVRIGGEWWTPPIEDGLLPGTYREVLVRDGRLRERSLEVADVRRADAVALVSSVRGWREAVVLPDPRVG
jgi:para-aminobenzoate synthetase/4-amino-4-deoxychorismate lyase